MTGKVESWTHDQLNCIAKGSIHQPTEGLAKLGGELLRREAKQGGERDDGEKVDDKGGRGAPAEQAGENAERDKEEQQVDVVAEDDDPSDIGDLHRTADPYPIVFLQLVELATSLLAKQGHMFSLAVLEGRHAVAVQLGGLRLVARESRDTTVRADLLFDDVCIRCKRRLIKVSKA